MTQMQNKIDGNITINTNLIQLTKKMATTINMLEKYKSSH